MNWQHSYLRAKRATASLPVEYISLNEPLPKAGDLSIILDSKGNPVGIIERTSVDLVPFQTIDEKFAAYEGEGDGSLRYWREAHTWYFNRVCSRLGGRLEESTPILCQRFKLVWPLPRIAVVLIHGIGEQRAMATLRTFVSDVRRFASK